MSFRLTALALVAASLVAFMFGCASGAGVQEANDSMYPNGADGDREVAAGPGLFSGEKGGWEFDLADLLRRRKQASEAGVEENTGPE